MNNELGIQRLKRDYLAGLGTLKDLAKLHGIPYPTALRHKKTGNWEAERYAAGVTGQDVQRAIADKLSHGSRIDQVGILENAITNLTEELKSTELKSKEGALSVLVKLLDAHRDRMPETVEDIVARCVELDIKPQDFLRKLDEAYRG